MKAISIHQPWAHAILHLGKCVENRSWPTRHRGPLLIHASKSRASHDAQAGRDWRALYGVELPPWEGLVTGAIVGVGELVACLPLEKWKEWRRAGLASAALYDAEMLAPWACGPWCWVLAHPRAFARPVPWKGQQNLFEVSDEKLPAVR